MYAAGRASPTAEEGNGRMTSCPNCGSPGRPGYTSCLKCGTPLPTTPPPQHQPVGPGATPHNPFNTGGGGQPAQPGEMSPKSKVVYAVLAFFLGSLGIHNFYLGYTGRGLAQLALTILGCIFYVGFAVWIWALIEMVLALTGNLKDPQGRTLSS